jgi:hypothetical protein
VFCEPLDEGKVTFTNPGHTRMVWNGGKRVHSVSGSVRPCIRAKGLIRMLASASRMSYDTSVP